MKSKRIKSPRKKSKSKCKKYLQKKIGINMSEFKKGRYVSPSQAIAVSYSETLKKFPGCKRVFGKRKSKKCKSKSKGKCKIKKYKTRKKTFGK